MHRSMTRGCDSYSLSPSLLGGIPASRTLEAPASALRSSVAPRTAPCDLSPLLGYTAFEGGLGGQPNAHVVVAFAALDALVGTPDADDAQAA